MDWVWVMGTGSLTQFGLGFEGQVPRPSLIWVLGADSAIQVDFGDVDESLTHCVL